MKTFQEVLESKNGFDASGIGNPHLWLWELGKHVKVYYPVVRKQNNYLLNADVITKDEGEFIKITFQTPKAKEFAIKNHLKPNNTIITINGLKPFITALNQTDLTLFQF